MDVQVLQPTVTKRQDQLQFLRFLAFFFVFMHHSHDFNLYVFSAWNAGISSVNFFFILSGFLTGYAAYGREISVSPGAIVRDIWKKLRKIYPLYFFTTVYFVFTSKLPVMLANFDFDNASLYITLLVRNLLLVQSWFDKWYFAYNGVGWYLSTAFFLYLFNLPASALLNKIAKQKHSFTTFGLLVCAFTFITIFYSYITYPYNPTLLQQVFPPARLGQYFSGMILGFVLHPVKKQMALSLHKQRNYYIMTAFEVLAIVLWILPLSLPKESWHNILVDSMISNYILISVFLLGHGAISRIFTARPLVLLGDISMECFLIHVVILDQMKYTPETYLGCVMCSFFCLGVTVLLSMYLNKLQKV